MDAAADGARHVQVADGGTAHLVEGSRCLARGGDVAGQCVAVAVIDAAERLAVAFADALLDGEVGSLLEVSAAENGIVACSLRYLCADLIPFTGCRDEIWLRVDSSPH